MVIGKAMIIPRIPINEPQMESDNRIMAELRPVTRPMIFGVRKASWMACTTANTINAINIITQKF